VEPSRLIQVRQGLSSDDTGEPIVPNQSPDHGAVLLFHRRLIVPLVGTAMSEFNSSHLAEAQQGIVDERSIVVGVNAPNRERDLAEEPTFPSGNSNEVQRIFKSLIGNDLASSGRPEF